MDEQDLTLTDHEGTFLALVLRVQPVTAYLVSKIYDGSPISNFNTSKGKIYPLIARLAERGLLEKQKIPGDARGTDQLRCTALGEAAVRDWVKEIKPCHLMLEDPLRTKVQSFDLLTERERIDWILDAKDMLAEQIEALERYDESASAHFDTFVHDNALRSVRARIAWLDTMLGTLLREGSPSR